MKSFQTGIVILSIILTAAAAGANSNCANASRGSTIGADANPNRTFDNLTPAVSASPRTSGAAAKGLSEKR